MLDEKPCILPEKEELVELLRDINNIVWYMRCQSVEGSPAAKRYLKQQIVKFKKERELKEKDIKENREL